MEETKTTNSLLKEIRDTQTEFLIEYRLVTRKSLEFQQRAVQQQFEHAKIYRRVVLGCVILVIIILSLIILLLGKYS